MTKCIYKETFFIPAPVSSWNLQGPRMKLNAKENNYICTYPGLQFDQLPPDYKTLGLKLY